MRIHAHTGNFANRRVHLRFTPSDGHLPLRAVEPGLECPCQRVRVPGGRAGARAHRKFTPEFKAEVVAMVEASGGKIAQVAREMRLHDSSVGNWVRDAREAKAGNGPTAAERAEIRELKAELERVTRERDILGKAVDGPGGPPVWMKSLLGRLVTSTPLGA